MPSNTARVVAGGWPAIGSEERAWESGRQPGLSHRARLRARGPYAASIPPFIADRPAPRLPADIVSDIEDAVTELARFDAEQGPIAAPFASILLRSESASSSEIEQLTARPRGIAMAALGGKSGPNARLIVANGRAMETAIALSDELDTEAIVAMHAALLAESDAAHSGRWRDEQVWIGGGASNSPHGASFVPPHHERVPALMADLVEFARRTDLPALTQVAIVHAQFETIHPFTDGNGRTGRAIVHSMLRRLGITRNVTVPVSAGLLRDKERYFDALTAYRRGDIGPILAAFARASAAAIANGRALTDDLSSFRSWAERTTTARRGSAGRRMIPLLIKQPILDAAFVASELHVTVQNAQAGIDRLARDGVVHQVGSGKRNRRYEARPVLTALDEFADRARRTR